MPYIANTEKDRKDMLDAIGLASMSELWEKAAVPNIYADFSKLPDGKSEYEVSKYLSKLASQNASDLTCFVGGGFYDHFIPAAVEEITSIGEFYTAYTPYQPEVSQGTLQAIFEYQSSICRLTGMSVTNASLYDGGTALFEAMMMSVRKTRKRKIILAGTVSPIYQEMIKCYTSNLDIELIITSSDDVIDTPSELLKYVDDKTASIIIQYPNVFGSVTDWSDFTEKLKQKKVISICSAYPIALAILKTPGEMGFDIVTGEGQSLGIPLSFGGPYLGFMATSPALMRIMPGRICGKSLDTNEKEGFVLTLQAREQHIRRKLATSNICSNEGLCALTAVAYLSCIGKEGLVDIARLCASKASYTKKLLLEIKGVKEVTKTNFFNEFVIELPCDAGELIGKMINKGFAAGFPLGRYYKDRKNQLLIALTEKRTKEEIKSLAVGMEAALWN